MKKSILFVSWGCLFILCAALGFIPEPSEKLQTGLTVLSVIFFLPPAGLLYDGIQRKDLLQVRLIRNLSCLSLILTVILLVINFLTIFASQTLGTVVYYTLVIVSAPMIVSGYWVLSLFLWACLLVTSLGQIRKNR